MIIIYALMIAYGKLFVNRNYSHFVKISKKVIFMKGQLRIATAISDHTGYRIGGFSPKNAEKVVDLLAILGYNTLA